MEEIKHLLPDMDEEQTLITKDFLRLIAHTCNTNTCCLIMRQNILTRDTYKQLRNPLDGKLHYVLENGDRIITGRKGIDWCKPGIYDVAHGDELMRLHEHCYPVKRRITKEWWDPVNNEYIAHKETVYVAPIRPSLYHTILTAGNKQKYLFAPATVALHPKIKYERTEYGIEYPTINHYTIADVRYARCLWVDIHGRNLPAKDIRQENPKALDQFMAILPTYCRQTGVPIPAVIDSGHGVQLYWWLEQAVQIHDAAAQDQFREILRAVNNWAKDLIRRLPLCNQTWTSDYTATPVYHLMDVPGCIDIRTGKRIYVVNRYGVDYTHYAYEALCKALGVREASEAQDQSDAEKPSADVTILDNLEGSAEESTLPSKSDSSPFPRYSPRVDKLLCWAEQRQWSLDHCRHLFLFCLGVVQQCGADIDLTNPENYPLHEINHKLKTPLSHQEVENIIS